MTIDFKGGAGGYTRIAQPFYKNTANNWLKAQKVLVKTGAGWKEVWPSEIVYRHTGVGAVMNCAACFGYPTSPANYIFINDGIIHGTVDTPALRTGGFPAGSTFTLINNDMITGSGGDGARMSSPTYPANPHALPGGDALLLETPTHLQMGGSAIIQGGGGGGGMADERSGTRYYADGGGGAGYPGGSTGGRGSYGRPSQPGTLHAGGSTTYGTGSMSGVGGGPGQPGQHGNPNAGNSNYKSISHGAPAGAAIINRGMLASAVNVRYGSNVKGPVSDGVTGPYIRYRSSSQTGNYEGGDTTINLSSLGALSNVTAYISHFNTPGKAIDSRHMRLVKLSNHSWRLERTGFRNTNYYGNLAYQFYGVTFTATAPDGRTYSFTHEFNAWAPATIPTYDHDGSCFTADSLVTMADGSQKRIDEIQAGEFVRTGVGISEVFAVDHPELRHRPLISTIDGRCKTSSEHSMWSRDPASKKQWWATRDIDDWRIEAENGSGPHFNGHEPFDLTENIEGVWDFATEQGWDNTPWKVIEDAPHDLILYNLWLREGGSYFVDGFLVSSIADKDSGVDWEAFTWDGWKE